MAGMFLRKIDSGTWVNKGDYVGSIQNPYGNIPLNLIAPYKAFVLGHENSPLVHQGDALFHLGQT